MCPQGVFSFFDSTVKMIVKKILISLQNKQFNRNLGKVMEDSLCVRRERVERELYGLSSPATM